MTDDKHNQNYAADTNAPISPSKIAETASGNNDQGEISRHQVHPPCVPHEIAGGGRDGEGPVDLGNGSISRSARNR